jgi:ATP-dependent helicase HrpA
LATLTEADYRKAAELSRQRLPGLASKLVNDLAPILQLRAEIDRRLGGRPGVLKDFAQLDNLGKTRPGHPLAGELRSLVPSRFLEHVPFERLSHMPRYLKALLLRIERAQANPLRDQERSRQVAPYLGGLERLRQVNNPSRRARQSIEEFRWLIEEFKVSLHAQELGTSVPVSAKRLDQVLEAISDAVGLPGPGHGKPK